MKNTADLKLTQIFVLFCMFLVPPAHASDKFNSAHATITCKSNLGATSESITLSVLNPNLSLYHEDTKPLDKFGFTRGKIYALISGEPLVVKNGSHIDYPTVRLVICARPEGEVKMCAGAFLAADKTFHAIDLFPAERGSAFNCFVKLEVR